MHVDMHVGWVMKCNQVQVGVCRLMEVKNAPDKSLPVGFYQFPRMVWFGNWLLSFLLLSLSFMNPLFYQLLLQSSFSSHNLQFAHTDTHTPQTHTLVHYHFCIVKVTILMSHYISHACTTPACDTVRVLELFSTVALNCKINRSTFLAYLKN